MRAPPIAKIWEDLDAFRDYCRHEGRPFNEAALYKRHDRIWQNYQKFLTRTRYKGPR